MVESSETAGFIRQAHPCPRLRVRSKGSVRHSPSVARSGNHSCGYVSSFLLWPGVKVGLMAEQVE